MQRSVIYVTSNESKLLSAKRYLEPEGITVLGKHLEMIEIQSHSGKEIVIHKAKQAFEKFQKPLIVSDHFWNIPALNGFPGAYMKDVSEWLSPQDFLNLIKPYNDRTIYLEEHMCFIDKYRQELFYAKRKGEILKEIHGDPSYKFRAIVTLRKDGKSIADCWEDNTNAVDHHDVWKNLADWMKLKHE